ncbi:MAG: hypothetical protein CM1200mP41_34290 [Gammaproteobacteria bacterium]|nr:MAG: hypothetical protein CM1200mP41_34290 [Gammaproteobacteria bacterium]
MNDFSNAIAVAWELVMASMPTSLRLCFITRNQSVCCAHRTLVALPLGAAVAVFRFPGRGACIVLLNALMGGPPGGGGALHLSPAVAAARLASMACSIPRGPWYCPDCACGPHHCRTGATDSVGTLR